MESILGGFPLPRRLTKMYSDTKNLSEFVKEPAMSVEDPELKSLHRRLRIQKDRLVTWGLNWSESSQAPDIDESLHKAGLSELVGSVMANIKETLAEAEPLWQSYRAHSESSEKKPIAWDRGRFEDLIKDLTTSIDTLYDLSKSCEAPAPQLPARLKKEESSRSMPIMKVGEERLFESTRIQTPQQIDPASLIPYEVLHGRDGSFLGLDNINEQVAQNLIMSHESRQIVFLKRQLSSTNPWKTDGPPPLVPVFLEYAGYDSIYANTGISPPMTRFARLFAGLQVSTETKSPEHGVLNLIGYFEDTEHARFGLIYKLSGNFRPAARDLEPYSTTSLSILLSSPTYEPPLEGRYRLAYNLASSVLQIHAKSVIHSNLCAANVVFFHELSSEADIRKPFLVSFDLFSEDPVEETPTSWHALDPRINAGSGLTEDSKSLDLYGLALMLLQIGLWASLPEIFPTRAAFDDRKQVFKQLAFRCGSLYARCTERFWGAPEDELTSSNYETTYESYYKGLSGLEKCASLDESEELEPQPPQPPQPPLLPTEQPGVLEKRAMTEKWTDEVARHTLAPASDTHLPTPALQTMRMRAEPPRDIGPMMRDEKPRDLFDSEDVPVEIMRALEPRPEKIVSAKSEKEALAKSMTDARPDVPAKPKLRLYPTVRIAQEHIVVWQSTLMPRINHVLRGFYRKHPESVEISFESVGESPKKCKPTIVVICTSVDKVRYILKKHFDYDKSVYGLKVCRGRMMRSKFQARRSMARDQPYEPANPDHQDRPLNGASIGACIEKRHLAPVSFGGLITVDGRPYGMTVHHMLDEGEEYETTEQPPFRSSAYSHEIPDLDDTSSYGDDDEYCMALSDYDSDATSMPASISDYEIDDDDDFFEEEPGDVPGIPAGCGDGYAITQPAIDDMDDDFYPTPEDRDEEHLDLFTVGEVFASSGIRRKESKGLVHEIDWALFQFSEDRLPTENEIRGGRKFCKSPAYLQGILDHDALADKEVHCMARTSGLRTGRILPGLTTVKIYGRQTPSHSYQVTGGLGVPGDSGAWVIDNEEGLVCGHVLAWSSRKQVAYICPMEVLLQDIADTLAAREISLPGGEPIIDRTAGTVEVVDAASVRSVGTRPSSSDGKSPIITYTPKDSLVAGMTSMRISDGLSMA